MKLFGCKTISPPNVSISVTRYWLDQTLREATSTMHFILMPARLDTVVGQKQGNRRMASPPLSFLNLSSFIFSLPRRDKVHTPVEKSHSETKVGTIQTSLTLLIDWLTQRELLTWHLSPVEEVWKTFLLSSFPPRPVYECRFYPARDVISAFREERKKKVFTMSVSKTSKPPSFSSILISVYSVDSVRK